MDEGFPPRCGPLSNPGVKGNVTMNLINRLCFGTALAVLLLLAVSPVAAQTAALSGFVGVGGYTPLLGLDSTDSETAKFKTGFSAGAMADLELWGDYLAIRGIFTFAQSELSRPGVATDTKFDKLFFAIDFKFQYPAPSGLTPYVFGGVGIVRAHEHGTSDIDYTDGAIRFGLGLSYRIPGSGVVVFLQGDGWVYDITGAEGALSGIDKTQFDLVYMAGLGYRIRF